jgi:formylglycine-generating enzyme required for sulfatase activity
MAAATSPGAATTTTRPAPAPGVVTVRMATVADPGNAAVGVVSVFGGEQQFVEPPANGGIYASCSEAPAAPPECITYGGVDYTYGIGALEVTVEQYVAFLNAVDPTGSNRRNLFLDVMNTEVWPEYGPIALATGDSVEPGTYYSVAYPEWADKPFGFADFPRAARFTNSLFNGKVLSKQEVTEGAFEYVDYSVRLSRRTERGMYDMSNEATERTSKAGFVIPSNDEWGKAAYYDPNGGGTLSYWQYPTGPSSAPNASLLDPTTGDVVNGSQLPLASYNPGFPNAPAGTYPTWCPEQAGASACTNVNPVRLPPGLDPAIYQGNVSTVGQTRSPSPWGTYDQGGNVVEWQDTIVDAPPGYTEHRVWRRMHGGVANAPSYQMLISAFGFQPQDQVLLDGAYPWFGFRVGIVGDSD